MIAARNSSIWNRRRRSRIPASKARSSSTVRRRTRPKRSTSWPKLSGCTAPGRLHLQAHGRVRRQRNARQHPRRHGVASRTENRPGGARVSTTKTTTCAPPASATLPDRVGSRLRRRGPDSGLQRALLFRRRQRRPICPPRVMERTMLHTDNSYYLPNVDIRGRVCFTNYPSNTAFRGFGGPQWQR